MVLSYKDKGDWILETKYNIGAKKKKVEETEQKSRGFNIPFFCVIWLNSNVAFGDTIYTRLQRRTMTSLQRYHSANLPELMKIISKNGIGMDDYLDRFFNSFETTTNYPPYNLIHVNNVESVLEIALAGFAKKDLKVYTEYGKLIVEGSKETKDTGSEYVHQGLAQRSFTREWALSDDVEVREVQFKDGLLTVKLGKVVPDHHARKDYLK